MLRETKMLEKKYKDFYIYKITNPNDQVYIGVTTNIKNRIKVYSTYPDTFKNQTNLHTSITKYGWDKHKITILATYNNLLINELSDIEQEWIFKFYYKNPEKVLNGMIKGVDRHRPSEI